MSNAKPNIVQSIFSALEKKILIRWKQENTFNRSVELNDKKKDNKNNEFVFYDGPPFANGLPHYGHLLTGFIKDAIARYQTIRGKRVERRFGWDCHGLPAEMEIEKSLNTEGKKDIKERIGIGQFNEQCRQSVMKYEKEWEYYVETQGRWVNFKDNYKTMDLNYTESVIWAFKRLFDMNLIYEDFRVVPYSWKCETTVSNFETRMDNAYRQKESKAIYVKVRVKYDNHIKLKKLLKNNEQLYIIIWTTTPWTLPSNLAIAINRNTNYSIAIKGDVAYIFAKELQDKIEKII